MTITKRHAIVRKAGSNETIYIVNYNPSELSRYLETIYELAEMDYEFEKDEDGVFEMGEEEVSEGEEVQNEDEQIVQESTPVAENAALSPFHNGYFCGAVGSLVGMYILIFCIWLGSFSKSMASPSRDDEL